MNKKLVVWILCLVICPIMQAQQLPQATDLSGRPYFLKKNWMIGGFSSWDFLKLDPASLQLLIARGRVVQVVDIETGDVTGEIEGLQDAHAIALDHQGQFGFISDGAANQVAAFDRRSNEIVAQIPTGPGPRALVYDRSTGLIFAICGQPRSDHRNPIMPGPDSTPEQIQRSARQARTEPGSYAKPKAGAVDVNVANAQKPPAVESIITVIDADSQQTVANILLRGKAGFAQGDHQGRVFVNIVDQNAILRLDAQGIKSLLDKQIVPLASDGGQAKHSRNPRVSDNEALLDWTGTTRETTPPDGLAQRITLGTDCSEPEGLAVDSTHLRLFVGCGNSKLAVVNSDTGASIATVPTSSGTGVVQYDAARGLIFVASGDVGGMLTIIRQDVNDGYKLVQNLPTAYRARVLEVNQTTGEVYLVTDGGQTEARASATIRPRRPGMSELTNDYPTAVESSFHVLVVDH
jgi:DNA-binding beta-propeller fold protein YncE